MLNKLTTLPAQKQFRADLLTWYEANKRDLPWRRNRVAYRVWVSEIMLQQTRVAAVLDHYRRFLKRFPTVKALAHAPESDVLALWSGLGYYRRARFMHAAAKVVVSEHRGQFPRTAEGLLQLPGIGRYTAAAIASICFLEPVPVVDGNVLRVLDRLYGDPPKDPWITAAGLLEPENPGDFNQAMMELGALVCVPGEPQCLQCPVRIHCKSQGRTKAVAKRLRPKSKAIYYRFCMKDNHVLLQQRAADASLMPSMWELPQIKAKSVGNPALQLRHSITDTNYEVSVVVGRAPRLLENHLWVATNRVAQLPLTGLARKVLSRLDIL